MCTEPQKHIFTWLPTVCDSQLSSNGQYGEIKYDKLIYQFEIELKDHTVKIIFKNTHTNPTLQGLLKRAIYKATYCINCEACEVECPTGALSILPDVKIDQQNVYIVISV